MTLPATSFSMVLTGNRQLKPMDLAIPDIDEDSAILKLEACGICGSDHEQFEGLLRTPTRWCPQQPLELFMVTATDTAGFQLEDR